MKNNLRYLFFLFLTIPTLAMAGHDQGNGGDGYIDDDGAVYLLDLVEAGMEKSPYFANAAADAKILARVEMALHFLQPQEAELTARKLTEITNKQALIGRSLLKVMEMYSWALVSHSLVNVPDENTQLNIPANKLTQAAIRRNHSIMISRLTWSKMPVENRVALVFHEVLYAMVPPSCYNYLYPSTGQQVTYCHQESPRAREIVGYLFSPQMQSPSTRLENLISKFFPTDYSGQIEEDGSLLYTNQELKVGYVGSPRSESSLLPDLITLTPENRNKHSYYIDAFCRSWKNNYSSASLDLVAGHITRGFLFEKYLAPSGIMNTYARIAYLGEQTSTEQTITSKTSTANFNCSGKFKAAVQKIWPSN